MRTLLFRDKVHCIVNFTCTELQVLFVSSDSSVSNMTFLAYIALTAGLISFNPAGSLDITTIQLSSVSLMLPFLVKLRKTMINQFLINSC